MNCEKCSNKEATVHLTEIISNIRSEVHLCDNCAKDIGLNKSVCNINDQISITGNDYKKCKYCGVSIDEFIETGLVGCIHCYELFKENILDIIGKGQYSGPYPTNRGSSDSLSYPIHENNIDIVDLKKKLHVAVHEENYEDAVVLRDIIRQRENNA